MLAKQRNKAKLALLFIGTLVLYNEFLTYSLQSMFKWPLVSCSDPSCIKVLLVADPQIIGEQLEGGFPIADIARWDCDRFLSKTFQHAVSHVNPDVVAFLGDIMDEGSIATIEEYTRYTNRFLNIFETSTGKIQYIYIPGDNDIGGEDDDQLTSDKIKRFYWTFNQPDSFRIKTVDFYKVNRLTLSIPRNISTEDNKINVILTHLPLLFLPNHFAKKVVKRLRPQVIFSAHEHKSYALHTPATADFKKDDHHVETLFPSEGSSWQYRLNKSVIHEILVPTCSYRMGVQDVGYGVAVFDGMEEMQYSVLWLPSRFTHLRTYLGLLICAVLYWCIWSCGCFCLSIRKKNKNTKCMV